MSDVNIFWDPKGFQLDRLGTSKFRRITDGDTPFVEISIRMLSVDSPEVHYPGTTNPARHDDSLKQLADWIEEGKAPVDDDLGAFLHPKLATGKAGSLQKEQGIAATADFQKILDAKLTKESGRKRSVFLVAADQPFDMYGRLLAYMAPSYTSKEKAGMSLRERATFNLLTVESGWAATFLIYPNLPKYRDLVLLHKVARAAIENSTGMWANPLTLTGYEFRMCYRLWNITRKLDQGRILTTSERSAFVKRYCADMTTREIFEPQHYHRVASYNRIFVDPREVNEAVGKISLLPGHT